MEWCGILVVGSQRWELWHLPSTFQWLLPRLCVNYNLPLTETIYCGFVFMKSTYILFLIHTRPNIVMFHWILCVFIILQKNLLWLSGKVPGDDCPLVWGQCSHCFHMHCILKWLNSQQVQQQCPMCRQEWKFKEWGRIPGNISIRCCELKINGYSFFI